MLVLAAHCTLDSTLCYSHCLTRRQESIWKHQCYPSSASLISAPRGKQCLARYLHGHRQVLKSCWLPGSSPPKEPQQYLQELQRWRRGRSVWAEADTNRPPFGGSHRSASEEPFEWLGSFKTWKAMLHPAVLPNVSKQPLHMSKQQTPFGCCYYFCGCALAGVKYYRFQTEILCWEIENRVELINLWARASYQHLTFIKNSHTSVTIEVRP